MASECDAPGTAEFSAPCVVSVLAPENVLRQIGDPSWGNPLSSSASSAFELPRVLGRLRRAPFQIPDRKCDSHLAGPWSPMQTGCRSSSTRPRSRIAQSRGASASSPTPAETLRELAGSLCTVSPACASVALMKRLNCWRHQLRTGRAFRPDDGWRVKVLPNQYGRGDRERCQHSAARGHSCQRCRTSAP